jgi:PAS domain S-box-containing protein
VDVLIERIPDAFVASDGEGRVVRWNPAATALLGYREDEAVGRRIAELLVPEHQRAAHVAGVARAHATGAMSLPAGPIALEALHRDGHVIPVELSLARMEDGPAGWAFIAFIRDVRERADFVARLEEAHGLFRGAFDNTSVGMAITSPAFRILQANAAMGALLGTTADQLVGHSFTEFTHPDDRAVNEAQYARASAEETDGFRFEKRYVRVDGGEVWVDLSVSAVADADGHPRFYIGQALDIGERKAAEAQLELERGRLADAQSLAHLGSWEWDIDRDEMVWSAELCDIFGVAHDAHPRTVEAWMAYVHPDDRTALTGDIAATQSGVDSEGVYRIMRPDGQMRWLNGRRRALPGPGRRVVGTTQDITARREAEERRRRAEALLSQALEHAPTGIAVIGLDGRFETVNRALCELTGYGEDELVGRSFAAFTHPDVLQHAAQQRMRLGRGEIDRYDNEEPCLTRSGETVWVQLSVSTVRDDAGRPGRFIMQVQDITDRRAAAQALRDSERAALDASAMKSQFLANMSHEIRTPMNGVLGMVDALLHSSLTEEQRRHAETARSSAEALLTIIDDVLDFSKVEAGHLALESTPIDLIELLEETRDLLWHRARARGLRLVVHVDPAVGGRVLGDPVRVRQVLVNLVTNAIKFSERGEVVITVTTDPDGRVRFAVADQGIGIDAATLARLFQPFTQADASTTRRFGGTGLGLAISRQLAELMGGEIGATSEPGTGSTFWFTAALERQAAAGDEPATVLDGVHALVCSDCAAEAAALGALLERWGARATVAAPRDAERAQLVAAAGGAAPSVVVLADPPAAADALALLRRLRERAAGELPAVLLGVETPTTGLPAGVRGFVAPQRSVRLRRALAELTGRAGADPVAAARPATPPPDTTLGEGRRVLVAEDNEVNQQVAVLSLRRRGFAVDVAADGAEAVAAAAQTTYDLIFMDCQMPRMDGFEATEAIRSAPAGSRTPIIAMTASSMAEDRERCAAAGMDDFVSKPVRPEDLDAVLRRWLAARSGA